MWAASTAAEIGTSPVETIQEILARQGDLVLQKADAMLAIGNGKEQARAIQARSLVRRSRDVSSLKVAAGQLLYPSDYRIRAEMLVEARRLVGGVQIERL